MKTIFHSGLVLSGNNKLGSLRQRNCVWRDRPRELLGSAFHFSQPMRLSGGGVNLRCRRFRHLAGLPVFLQRLTFRLQPIVHTLSMSAAAFDVDLVCAQLDFFTCGMALGSPWFVPRRGFFYRFGHDSLLWPEFRIPILLLEKSCTSNPLFQISESCAGSIYRSLRTFKDFSAAA